MLHLLHQLIKAHEISFLSNNKQSYYYDAQRRIQAELGVNENIDRDHPHQNSWVIYKVGLL